jgi:hypothetical protein
MYPPSALGPVVLYVLIYGGIHVTEIVGLWEAS